MRSIDLSRRVADLMYNTNGVADLATLATLVMPSEVDVLAAVIGEVVWAQHSWPKFNTAHEGYAVLLEEVDELWDHVKTNQKKQDVRKMQAEAVQVAAMAIRFALEVCDEKTGRR